MEIGKLIENSFGYTKDGLFGNLATWIILIILTLLPVIPIILSFLVLIPSLIAGKMPDIGSFIGVFVIAVIAALILSAFYLGYQMKILRGETPLPIVSGYGRLFADGIRYLVIEIIYSIPVFFILALTIGGAIMSSISAAPAFEDVLPIIGGVIIGISVALIVGFIIGLFAVVGLIRFARTGRMSEAFNFGAIMTTISQIGWGHYILALIVVVVLIAVVEIVLGVIPYIGGILQILISPFITLFYSRYVALLYESAEEGTNPAVEVGS